MRLFTFTIIALLSINSMQANAKPIVSPYVDFALDVHWDQEHQDLEPLDYTPIALQNHINSLHLAFITDGGQCNPAWGGFAQYSSASLWGKRLTDRLHQENIETVVSFGGASGVDLTTNCNVEQLTTLYSTIQQTYQAKKLDFDIENGTVMVPKLMKALKSFQNNHQNIALSLTLPIMPSGLTNIGEDIVTQAKNAGVNFSVNIMAMDYGTAYQGDMGQYAIQAATALHTFLKKLYPNLSDQDIWKKIEVTPMVGVNDTPGEQFSIQNATALNKFATQKNINGLSMWSLNRDKPCSDQWVNLHCSGNNLQQKDYEYVKSLLN